MITRKTKLQLLAFTVVALLGISYVGFNYVGLDRLLLGTGYEVEADFADSGGIFVNAEVTYRGVAVGRVSDMQLTEDGVRVTLTIDPDAEDDPGRHRRRGRHPQRGGGAVRRPAARRRRRPVPRGRRGDPRRAHRHPDPRRAAAAQRRRARRLPGPGGPAGRRGGARRRLRGRRRRPGPADRQRRPAAGPRRGVAAADPGADHRRPDRARHPGRQPVGDRAVGGGPAGVQRHPGRHRPRPAQPRWSARRRPGDALRAPLDGPAGAGLAGPPRRHPQRGARSRGWPASSSCWSPIPTSSPAASPSSGATGTRDAAALRLRPQRDDPRPAPRLRPDRAQRQPRRRPARGRRVRAVPRDNGADPDGATASTRAARACAASRTSAAPAASARRRPQGQAGSRSPILSTARRGPCRASWPGALRRRRGVPSTAFRRLPPRRPTDRGGPTRERPPTGRARAHATATAAPSTARAPRRTLDRPRHDRRHRHRRPTAARSDDGRPAGGRAAGATATSAGAAVRVPLAPLLGVLLLLLLAVTPTCWHPASDESFGAHRLPTSTCSRPPGRRGRPDLLRPPDHRRRHRAGPPGHHGDLTDESVSGSRARRQQIVDAQAVTSSEVVGAGGTPATEDEATVVMVIATTRQRGRGARAGAPYTIQVDLEQRGRPLAAVGIRGPVR